MFSPGIFHIKMVIIIYSSILWCSKEKYSKKVTKFCGKLSLNDFDERAVPGKTFKLDILMGVDSVNLLKFLNAGV